MGKPDALSAERRAELSQPPCELTSEVASLAGERNQHALGISGFVDSPCPSEQEDLLNCPPSHLAPKDTLNQ